MISGKKTHFKYNIGRLKVKKKFLCIYIHVCVYNANLSQDESGVATNII